MKQLLLILAITTGLSSCKKYEEGPSFTLLSAKARISGNWTLSSFTTNGNAVNFNGAKSTLDVKKEDVYTNTSTFGSISFSETGKWKFSGDKKKVTFTPDNKNSAAITYDILELRDKEMKLKRVNNGNTEISTYNQ